MILYYGCRGKSGDVREKVGKVVVGIWGVSRREIAENSEAVFSLFIELGVYYYISYIEG